MVGAIVRKAATRYVRKSAGSFSPLSSDSQATCRSQPATHALTSVVLPKPAGAAMRVNLRCRPSFSRSSRRGRLTTFGRSRGRYSFVARIGVGMNHPPHFLSQLFRQTTCLSFHQTISPKSTPGQLLLDCCTFGQEMLSQGRFCND